MRRWPLTPILIPLAAVLAGIIVLGDPALGSAAGGMQGPRIVPRSIPAGKAHVPGRVLVRFSEKARPRAGKVLGDMGLLAVEHLREIDVYVVRVDPGSEVASAESLAKHPDVEYAEPDTLVYALSTPNDPWYAGYQWNLAHIAADDGWDTTTGSSSVTLAVLDTGVDLQHPDLADKIVAGYDFANDDSEPADDHGHGTHVASIAAACTDNAEGVAGVSWGTRIMPVKVLGADGVGSLSWVASGICWAAEHGADIINMSLGGPSGLTVQTAINYAHDVGVLMVASAGNEYQEGNPTTYPAACDHVLAVAATDHLDGHATYSNSGSYVDVAAPGGCPSGIGDTVPEHWIIGAYWRGGGYSYAWGTGTSQAAPHVSGLAALLLSVDASLTPDDLEALIRGTAKDVASTGWDEFTGDGRIDVSAALAAAGAQLSSSCTLTKHLNTPEPVRVETPLSFTIRITNTGDSWIGILPLRDVYSTTYLAYGWKDQYADPDSNDHNDDGLLEWSDLTESLGQDLAPGASFSVVVTFTAKADTTDPLLPPDGETVNTAIVEDVFADPDGAGPLQAETWVPPQQGSDDVRIFAPTGVTLADLRGVAMPDCVLVTWETTSEMGMLGFNVLRRSAEEEYRRVNEDTLLAEHAGSHHGALYAFRDEDVAAGQAYDYVLEVVQPDDRVGQHGPVSVTARWWLRLPMMM